MTVELTLENSCQRAKLRPRNPWKVELILARIPIVRINENAGQVNLSNECVYRCMDACTRVRMHMHGYMHLHTYI